MPIGLIKGVMVLANNHARDYENGFRFDKAIINSECSITSDSQIGIKSHIYQKCIINHSQIGNYTYISRNSFIQHCKIGNYCSISHEVVAGLGNHPLNLFSTSPLFYKKHNASKIQVIEQDSDFVEYQPIEIGNDVWIGARVVIMDGIKIGNGAVIAAGAIVTKDVPAYAIVGGVPARIIRYRVTEERIQQLERSQWWNYPPDKALTFAKQI